MSEDVQTNAPTSVEHLRTGMAVKGTVKRLELYGAFVDIGIGQDALLHISQLGQTKVRNIEDVVKVGDTIDTFVLKVDKEANRVALTMMKPAELSWDDIKQGQNYPGRVVRLEKFGVFVDIGAERPGMVHVSELTDGFVKDPADVVKEGQEVNVRVLKINRKKRQIDLSMREPAETIASVMPDDEDLPTAMELAFRRANEGSGGGDTQQDKRAKASAKRRQQQADIIAKLTRDQN